MTIIEVENLSKIYMNEGVRTEALKGASFSVESEEFVSIMGPSGSGKSTLLHILGFLDDHTSGVYKFMGKSFKDYTPDEVAKIRNEKMGFVFQAFNLLARTKALENIKLPLIYSDTPESRWDELAEKALGSVGLLERAEHEPSELSGGEKQRVAIARALVTNPEVIFADEPTGNLDSVSGRLVMDILERLNKEEGKTIILITHDQSVAEHANRIIRLRDGMIESDKRLKDSLVS